MNRMQQLVATVLLCLLLAGCGSAAGPAATPPPPTSISAPATAAPATAVPLIPTASPVPPTATAAPTSTPVPIVPTATAAPTSTPVPNTPTATEPAATATVPATTGYNGEWHGTSDPDAAPFNFTVDANQVSYVNLNWSISVNGCSGGGGIGLEPNDSSITGSTFVAHLSSSGLDFTLQGTFTSDSAASGTLAYQGKSDFCGAVPRTQVKWSAQKGGEPTPEPTAVDVEPTATREAAAGGNTELVSEFFSALNTGALDTAMQQVDSNVIFHIGSASGIGAAPLKTYLQTQLSAGTQYSVDNLKATGDIVSFSIQVSSNGALRSGTIILNQGRIQTLTFK